MQQPAETNSPPVALPPGVGVGPAVAPSSYLLHRHRRDVSYKGLVDPVNARLTLKHLRFAHAATFAADVLRAARAHDVGKVLLYAAPDQWQDLLGQGFVLEGILDGFFAGRPAYLMGYLLQGARRACGDLEREQAALEAALAVAPEPAPPLPAGYDLVSCGPEQAAELAAVFTRVFTTFPSPVQDPAFVHRLIASGDGIFLAARRDSRMASVAAAELDREFGAAEMTNCATLPAHRGEGLMQVLLERLEQDLARQGVPTLFSLARAPSFGMNRVLRKSGYTLRGRLRGNSHIMGGYEDMNLWVKLPPAPGSGH